MNFINFSLLNNHPFFKMDEIQEMLKNLLEVLKLNFSNCELVKRDSFSYDLLFDNSFDYISKIELNLSTKTPIISFKSNIILEPKLKEFIEIFTNKIDVILHNKSKSTFYSSITIDINNEINYKICVFSGNCTFLATLNKDDLISKNYNKLKESFSETNICKELYPDYLSNEFVENFDSIVALISMENI